LLDAATPYGLTMTRGVIWGVAFAVVAMFVAVGAFFDDRDQRTWALISTIGIAGLVVIAAIYLAVNGLQRLRTKAARLRPRAFRRR
jgi:hypothetical protein